MKNEKPPEWKTRWRNSLITAVVVFFILVWLAPQDLVTFFVLLISGPVHGLTIGIFLIRRLKKATNVDFFMVKFGVIIYFLILLAAFLITDHAIPE